MTSNSFLAVFAQRGFSENPLTLTTDYKNQTLLLEKRVFRKPAYAKAAQKDVWESPNDYYPRFISLICPVHGTMIDGSILVQVLVQHRAENTKSIQKSLSKRLEILRRLTEAAKDAAVATSVQVSIEFTAFRHVPTAEMSAKDGQQEAQKSETEK